MLVLFSLLGALHLGSADRRLLQSLGFPLPTSEALECDLVQEPKELFGRPLSASPRDVGLPPTEKVHAPWLVEVCAGSAVLSATALRAGWNALPIDQPSCRFLAHTPLFSLDMRQSSSPVLLASFASRANVAWYHFGLPCGTCSRARERPLPNAPRPLRDADNLFGKAGLRPAEQEQVKAANQVYEQAVEVLSLHSIVGLSSPLRTRCGVGCGRCLLCWLSDVGQLLSANGTLPCRITISTAACLGRVAPRPHASRVRPTSFMVFRVLVTATTSTWVGPLFGEVRAGISKPRTRQPIQCSCVTFW